MDFIAPNIIYIGPKMNFQRKGEVLGIIEHAVQKQFAPPYTVCAHFDIEDSVGVLPPGAPQTMSKIIPDTNIKIVLASNTPELLTSNIRFAVIDESAVILGFELLKIICGYVGPIFWAFAKLDSKYLTIQWHNTNALRQQGRA
jgi:hypothetical protein